MAKGTRFGRQAQEKAWQNAEVDALYRLAAAGVTVPRPYNFHEGVLIMQLVTDPDGNAAPRLNDVSLPHDDELSTGLETQTLPDFLWDNHLALG